MEWNSANKLLLELANYCRQLLCKQDKLGTISFDHSQPLVHQIIADLLEFIRVGKCVSDDKQIHNRPFSALLRDTIVSDEAPALEPADKSKKKQAAAAHPKTPAALALHNIELRFHERGTAPLGHGVPSI